MSAGDQAPVSGGGVVAGSLTGRISHGAKPNTSDVRRTGYTMRYFPASVKVLEVEQNEGWKIWLARGEDKAGNTYEPDPRTAASA